MKKILFNTFIFVSAMCAITACSTEDMDTSLSSVSGSVKFNVIDAGVQSNGVGSRATIDATTFKTTFEEGDVAGVFGVRNGAVVEGMENLKLTFTVNGTWALANSLKYSESIADVKFYAYYPYDKDMAQKFNATATDPFAAAESAFSPSLDQSAKSSFNGSDLMVTGEAMIGSKLHDVNLVMNHCMSLARVELPNISYSFTNTGISTYVVAKAEKESFKLGDDVVKPYFDTNQQCYYLVLKPNTDKVLTASFTNNGSATSAKMETLSQVGKGKYASYIVDGGVNQATMTLQIGDYYLSDGNIVSKDATLTDAQKAKVIGIVYKLSVPSDVTSDHAACNHALIVSTNEVKAKWGTDGSTTSAENTAGYKTWNTLYDMVQLGTSAPKTDETTLMEIAYTQTKSWESIPDGIVAISSYSKKFCDIMQSTLKTQRETTAVLPSMACPWYTPALRDLINIDKNLEAINTSINNAGGTQITAANLTWSNQMSNQTGLWLYTFGTGINKRVTFKDSYYYRFISAF